MTDKILRRPPAYQVYAADDLASSRYYPLSAGERGVLDSMLRVCWVEDTVPSDPRLLALVLRLEESDLRSFLNAPVLAHFDQAGGDAERLCSRELTRQMSNVMDVRERQRQGGKEGARIAKEVRTKQPSTGRRKEPPSIASPRARRPTGRRAGPELNRDEENGEEQKQSLEDCHPRLSQEQAEWSRAYTEPEEEPSSGGPYGNQD